MLFLNSYFFFKSERKRHITSLSSATAFPILYPTPYDFCVTSATMASMGRKIETVL